MAKKKKTVKKKTVKKEAREFVIVRCRDAGVHAGYLAKVGKQIELLDARRIWYWEGAASLSELAVYGPNPEHAKDCRFGAKVSLQRLRFDDHCEIIACQPAGAKAIQEIPEWRA